MSHSDRSPRRAFLIHAQENASNSTPQKLALVVDEAGRPVVVERSIVVQ